MSVKHNDDVTTISKKHKKIIAEIIDFSLFLIKILIIFRIDVRTRNFEVLGRILASISAFFWDQVGPQSGSKSDLGASSTGFGKIFRKYVA